MTMTETELAAVNLRTLELVEDVRRDADGDLNEMVTRLAHRIAVAEFRAVQRMEGITQ